MACIVYRKGTGHIEDGIECERMLIEPGILESFLNSGWVGSVKELNQSVNDSQDESTFDNEDDLEGLNKEQLQQIAKELKVKSWHTCGEEALIEKIREARNSS